MQGQVSGGALFIVACTANVCRSPMAESIFSCLLNERGVSASVVSRGVRAAIGRAPHEYSLTIAALHGTPISPAKRAEQLTAPEVAAATAVFVMDSENKAQINKRFPTASGKIFLLGHWIGEEIADPINMPKEAFEVAWRLCRNGAQTWIDKLLDANLIVCGERKTA